MRTVVSISLGSVAERSKALVLGTSLFGGVGSNPTAAIEIFTFSVPYSSSHYCNIKSNQHSAQHSMSS